MMTAVDSKTYEKLWWGKKVMGLRVSLPAARAKDVKDLLRSAWQRKAPKNLLRSLDGD
jgi:hypothetical protein